MSNTEEAQQFKITHNTAALEAAILSSVKMASAPAYRAISEANFLRAKALFIRVISICALILCLAVAVSLVWLAVSKTAQQFSTSPVTEKVEGSNGQNPTVVVTADEKEKALREILQSQNDDTPKPVAKEIREISSNSKMARDLLNPGSSIGSLKTIIADASSANSEKMEEPTIVDNMIVGPEVQTLTVFKNREIKLANGLDVEIVAGHRYANNSSTTNWREGYCYVAWDDGLSFRVDLAKKPGKGAASVASYILNKEADMLGGRREVDKLRNLCPWLG